MPIVAMISTKLHVNAQSLFFGTLSFYILLKYENISRNIFFLSAFFAGIAIGFKITGILILPLLCLTIVNKYFSTGIKNIFINSLFYILLTLFIAVLALNPTLVLMPYYWDQWSITFNTIFAFKKMLGAVVPITPKMVLDALAYYFDLLSILFFLLLSFFYISSQFKKNPYFFYIFFTVICGFLLVITIEHKGPIYIATYFISLAFFLPLGLIGVLSLRFIAKQYRVAIAYLIIIVGLIYGTNSRSSIFESYNFYGLIKKEKVQNQLLANRDMRDIVLPLSKRVRILQDTTSIFPATSFADGVEVAFIYGDLKEKSSWERFDYILLNSNTYHNKGDNSAAADEEEKLRRNLQTTGDYAGKNYQLIYKRYDSLLYKLNPR